MSCAWVTLETLRLTPRRYVCCACVVVGAHAAEQQRGLCRAQLPMMHTVLLVCSKHPPTDRLLLLLLCLVPPLPPQKKGTKGSVSDKLRLALVQLLSAEAPPTDTELQELTGALHAAGGGVFFGRGGCVGRVWGAVGVGCCVSVCRACGGGCLYEGRQGPDNLKEGKGALLKQSCRTCQPAHHVSSSRCTLHVPVCSLCVSCTSNPRHHTVTPLPCVPPPTHTRRHR